MSFVNSYKSPPGALTKEQILATLNEPYDLNSVVPVPDNLSNDRISLVPFVPVIHAARFCTVFLANHPALQKFFPMPLGTNVEEFLYFVETVRCKPDRVLFAIIDKTKKLENNTLQSAGEIAGVIGWVHAAPDQLSLEIGPVIILPDFQGTHVTVNAIGLLLKYALDLPDQGGLGYLRVAWCAHPHNGKSLGIAGKIGFTKEGVRLWPVSSTTHVMERSEHASVPGNIRDGVILSILWDNWVGGIRDRVVERMLASD